MCCQLLVVLVSYHCPYLYENAGCTRPASPYVCLKHYHSEPDVAYALTNKLCELPLALLLLLSSIV
jgi:hypothetical protein